MPFRPEITLNDCRVWLGYNILRIIKKINIVVQTARERGVCQGKHAARRVLTPRSLDTARPRMKWLFVRAVCLKIDECSVVSITPVSQHKCRSVTLKGLSGQTWFNLSFFLSRSPRAARTCSSLLFIISKMNAFFVWVFFLFLPFSPSLWEGGGMVVYQWPSTCEEIISSCSLHALTIWEFNWSRGRSGRREGAFGAIFFNRQRPQSHTALQEQNLWSLSCFLFLH